MKESSRPAAVAPDALLVTTGSMRTLLPEVFSRHPQPSAVNEATGDLRFIEVNDAWLRFFGIERDLVVGRPARDVGIWTSAERRQQFGEVVRAHQRLRDFEIRARRHDGVEADLLMSWETFEHGGRTCLVSVFVDVTSRNEAERRLRESEQRFAAIVEHSPQPMTVTRLEDGVYLNVNHAFEALTGYPRAEVIGRGSLELGIWPLAGVREELKRQFAAGQRVASIETRARIRDGRLIDIFFSATVIDIDGQPALHGTVFDLTQIRQAVQARTTSEERFAKVFAASPSPILIIHQDTGVYADANQAWHDLLGYSAEDIAGQTSDSLNLWAEPSFRERRQKMLVRGEPVRNLETRMRTKSGATVDVLVSSEQVSFDGEAYMLTMMTDITERRRADEQIQYLATRDQLTGLPNRLLFSDRLRLALTRAARDHSHLALLFIDLDHFKDINDTLGHQAGDHLLMEVAARLSAVVRGADTLGRQGGDEFLLLLDGLADGAAAGPVAQKLVEALAAPFDYSGRAMKVSCSVGISIFPDDARTEEDLLRNADLAMYAAKESGRHGYRFYSPGMNQRLQERVALEQQLQGAVERNEFVLHYQPKVNFTSGLVTGCEALLRWHRPGRGLWQPVRFVSAAEDTRLIVPIGAWVLKQTCTTIRRWIDAGLAPVPVACNLSVHQFTAALPDHLAQVLRDTGVPGHLLQLEITETVMMTNASAHLDTMRRLKGLGVQIALDDFGTGYSSLSYLRHMDLDVLKIDRSFVRDLDSSLDAQAIVAAIIAMARSFDLKTVAEGVESPEQAQALRRMHCDDYQGFLFSQPLPAEQFEVQYLQPA